MWGAAAHQGEGNSTRAPPPTVKRQEQLGGEAERQITSAAKQASMEISPEKRAAMQTTERNQEETSQITANDSCSVRNKVLHTGHGPKPMVVHAGRHLRQMYSVSLPGISRFCSPNACCGNPR